MVQKCIGSLKKLSSDYISYCECCGRKQSWFAICWHIGSYSLEKNYDRETGMRIKVNE